MRGEAGRGWALGSTRAVVRRPRLWRVGITQTLRLAGPGWWRRSPFWPVPDPAWLAFRMETIYGRADARPAPEDLIDYLDWCRRMGRGSK
ncbi:MAG: hypothetical protein ACYCS7_01685 [Acidimicrobiales bacterium]